MEALGQSLSIVLFIIGFMHLLWGLKIWFPIRDEMRLARTVVGGKGITNMPPPLACFFVTAAVTVCGVTALALSGSIVLPYIPRLLLQIAAGGITLVFVMRGLIGYTPMFARMMPEEPFRTYDRWYYSPLCLLIGAGFGALLTGGAG